MTQEWFQTQTYIRKQISELFLRIMSTIPARSPMRPIGQTFVSESDTTDTDSETDSIFSIEIDEQAEIFCIDDVIDINDSLNNNKRLELVKIK